VRCDTNFNRARPLVDHLVDTNLEHLVGAERPAAQDNTMVEVISGAVKKIIVEQLYISNTVNVCPDQHYQSSLKTFARTFR